MANAKLAEIQLKLSAEEAGYLLDALWAHLGGTLATDREPLGRIRIALDSAGVKRLRAHRENNDYAQLYRNPEEVYRP